MGHCCMCLDFLYDPVDVKRDDGFCSKCRKEADEDEE